MSRRYGKILFPTLTQKKTELDRQRYIQKVMPVTLQDLITKLKELRVQEERVVQEIDHTLQQLHLQEETVINQNKDLTEKHSPKDTSRTPGSTSATRPDKTRVSKPASDRQKGVLDFKRGDRVAIKNRTRERP